MLKLIKFVAWVKANGAAIVGLIAAVTLIIGIIQTNRANKWERDHLRLEGKLEEQLKDQDLLYGAVAKLRAGHREELAAEAEKRETLTAQIEKLSQATVQAKQALEAEKKRTVTLPPITIVEEINERIGDESRYTAGGLFVFTRIGVNRTLDRFKDGEFYLAESNKLGIANRLYRAASVSFKTSLEASEQLGAQYLKGWEDCRETLDTALDDREALKRMARASIWRGRKQGAIGGSIITIVVCKVLGVF